MYKAWQYIFGKFSKNWTPCKQQLAITTATNSHNNFQSPHERNVAEVPTEQVHAWGNYGSRKEREEHSFFTHRCSSGAVHNWFELLTMSYFLAGAGSMCRMWHEWHRHRLEWQEIEDRRVRRSLTHIQSPCTSAAAVESVSVLTAGSTTSCDPPTSCLPPRPSPPVPEASEFVLHLGVDAPLHLNNSHLHSLPSGSAEHVETQPVPSGSARLSRHQPPIAVPPSAPEQNEELSSVAALFMAHATNVQALQTLRQFGASPDNVLPEHYWRQASSMVSPRPGYVPAQYNLATLYHHRARACASRGNLDQCVIWQQQAEQLYRLAWRRSRGRHVNSAYNLAVLLLEMNCPDTKDSRIDQEIRLLMTVAASANIKGAVDFIRNHPHRPPVQDVKPPQLRPVKSYPNFRGLVPQARYDHVSEWLHLQSTESSSAISSRAIT